jgi:hypothetical protein
MGGCTPAPRAEKVQETEKGALVKHLSPPHPFGAPLRPLGVERVELGARDERRARAHRFEVFAEFCDLVIHRFVGMGEITLLSRGDVTYLGLGFVYLCGELRVGWSALDPYQFCGFVTRVPSSQHICATRALISSLGWGQGTRTCRCGFDLRPQRLVALRERFCLFYESGDLVIGESIEIALVCDEECVLA